MRLAPLYQQEKERKKSLHLPIRKIGNSETNLQAKIALLKALPVDWYGIDSVETLRQELQKQESRKMNNSKIIG